MSCVWYTVSLLAVCTSSHSCPTTDVVIYGARLACDRHMQLRREEEERHTEREREREREREEKEEREERKNG